METIGDILLAIGVGFLWIGWVLAWVWIILTFPTTFVWPFGALFSLLYLVLIIVAYNRYAPNWLKNQVNERVVPFLATVLRSIRHFFAIHVLADQSRLPTPTTTGKPEVIRTEKVIYRGRSWKGALAWFVFGMITLLTLQNWSTLAGLF